jgi:hypothetical protein
VGQAEIVHQAFDIAPETLIVAATPSVGLLIASGTPVGAESRNEGRFLLGLAGAVVAVVSAVVLAIAVTGSAP